VIELSKTSKIDINQEVFIKQVAEGMSNQEQAQYWSCSKNTITRRRQSLNLVEKIKIDEKLFYKQVTEDRMSLAEQELYWGYGTHIIRRYRKELNCTNVNNKIKIEKTLFTEQVKNGMSIKEQANYWKCSKTTICDRRNKWELLLKTPVKKEWQPEIKKCKLCSNNFETIKYGNSRVYCYECSPKGTRQIATNLRLQMKKIAVEELGGECVKCKNNKIYVLDFHHRDSNEKDFNIGDLSREHCFNIYKEEIKKCVLLCANCHREFHWLLRQNKDLTIEKYCEQGDHAWQ